MHEDHKHDDEPETQGIRLQEYEKAQDMLKHYDSLVLQSGSILVSGVLVFTGIVLSNQVETVMAGRSILGLVFVATIPVVSFFTLWLWRRWYKGFSFMYNLRNEVLQRLEIQLGMYHFLRSLDADVTKYWTNKHHKKKREKRNGWSEQRVHEIEDVLKNARARAGYGEFRPNYTLGPFPTRGTDFIVNCITFGIPILQVTFLLSLWVIN